MSTIINGNFQDVNAAKRATTDLIHAGFALDQISSFVVSLPDNPVGESVSKPSEIATEAAEDEATKGTLSGAAVGSAIGIAVGLAALPVVGPMLAVAAVGVGAYGGSLYGALGSMDAADDIAIDAAKLAKQEARHRQSGTVVAVVANDNELQNTAQQILHVHGGLDIERREGILSNSKWTDFNAQLALQPLAA